MKLSEIITMWKKILILSRKPDREEYVLSIKISLLAFFLIGGIAYFVKLIAYLLSRLAGA
ncbi:MAG: protein translocase SEC61 complex subunit gamma [Desulfurococcales archaeon ex4484_217_1]|nr:MAG: protein translocase SEC61 complex subunit gamma [Desulfurococcales archaeon ex4484_217_1]